DGAKIELFGNIRTLARDFLLQQQILDTVSSIQYPALVFSKKTLPLQSSAKKVQISQKVLI
ncbi:MAG: hypothetical protein WCL00_13765, partial [Bacteroidota bacterium]